MSSGFVQVQAFGDIIVPGYNLNERMQYAQKLINTPGVFIPPPGKCTISIITWQKIPINTPVIAIGTLSNYICLTLNDLMHISIKDLLEYKYDLISIISYFPVDTYELINKLQNLL